MAERGGDIMALPGRQSLRQNRFFALWAIPEGTVTPGRQENSGHWLADRV
jgi:hypothetical protein